MTTSTPTPIKRRPGAPRKNNIQLQVCIKRGTRERLDALIDAKGGNLSGHVEQAIVAYLEIKEKD